MTVKSALAATVFFEKVAAWGDPLRRRYACSMRMEKRKESRGEGMWRFCHETAGCTTRRAAPPVHMPCKHIGWQGVFVT